MFVSSLNSFVEARLPSGVLFGSGTFGKSLDLDEVVGNIHPGEPWGTSGREFEKGQYTGLGSVLGAVGKIQVRKALLWTECCQEAGAIL